MELELPADCEAIVRKHVASGAYASETDVVVAAILQLVKREEQAAQLKKRMQDEIDSDTDRH
jgi:Arc/MetJ-type ribon-helix-helix transcriptional regulator